MADGYSYFSYNLNSPEDDQHTSEITTYLPHSLKQTSTYYPSNYLDALEDSNSDPFYLENALTDIVSWACYTPDVRDTTFSENTNQSSTDRGLLSFPVRDESLRRPSGIDRSSPSELMFEQDQRFAQHRNPRPHYRKGSFSSVETDTVPNLTPSSSFSSTYSAAGHSDTILGAAKRNALHVQSKPHSENGCHFYLPSSTPPLMSTQPSSPTLIVFPPTLPTLDESYRTPVMYAKNNNNTATPLPLSSCDLMKPLPSLPNNNTQGTPEHASKKRSNKLRPPIQPCMISAPRTIDPNTIKPHRLFNEQALFVSMNEDYYYPSPLPSPISNSSRMSGMARSAPGSKGRPSLSTSETPCEQSVWESDSDSDDETLSPRSLSRKPIDTLRKVRSKVQLRVARSGTKLNAAIQDEQQVCGNNATSSNNNKRTDPTRTKPTLTPHPSREGLRPTLHHRIRTARSLNSKSPTRSNSRNNSRQGDRSPTFPALTATATGTSTSTQITPWPWHMTETSSRWGEDETSNNNNDENGSIRSSSLGSSASRGSLFNRVLKPFRDLCCHTRI